MFNFIYLIKAKKWEPQHGKITMKHWFTVIRIRISISRVRRPCPEFARPEPCPTDIFIFQIIKKYQRSPRKKLLSKIEGESTWGFKKALKYEGNDIQNPWQLCPGRARHVVQDGGLPEVPLEVRRVCLHRRVAVPRRPPHSCGWVSLFCAGLCCNFFNCHISFLNCVNLKNTRNSQKYVVWLTKTMKYLKVWNSQRGQNWLEVLPRPLAWFWCSTPSLCFMHRVSWQYE